MPLTPKQQQVLELPISSKSFIYGPAGTGKTTVGTAWLKKLLKARIPAHEILVFVPQRALADPYQQNFRELDEIATSLFDVVTLGGLARRMVDLYWPMIAQKAGFAQPHHPPHFLTLETAQYYMAHIVRPLIEEQGFFNSLTINRNRIYAQILDNLNKAAFVGFPLDEIGERLKSAWVGDLEQFHIYDDVQACVSLFRDFCLENNLLDFSLQVEMFIKHIWSSPECRDYLNGSYRHLIADNLEEDTPAAHDLLKAWLPDFDSALLIFDQNAGYRYFLGADVQSAFSLRSSCQTTIQFEENLVSEIGINQIKHGVQKAVALLQGDPSQAPMPSLEAVQSALVRPTEKVKYFPDMVRWVSEQIAGLIQEGIPPGEIVVLAPFMPDVLRFALANQLDQLGIPNQSHRPSRPLRDEPATQTMLTLAALATPDWEMPPKRINLAFALMQAISGMDLIRSQLLTAYLYKPRSHDFPLQPFETLAPDIRDRITYRVGERYEGLRLWLENTTQEDEQPLDFFLNRLFGEVLSQPGFGFHNDMDSGNIVASLIESIQKFRWAVSTPLSAYPFSIGKEYIQMVQDGVIAAQYLHTWQSQDQDAVFLSPAYTFLIKNQPVDIQFWLDIGSPSWYQRLDQPLTQPYVLSRRWQKGNVWTAENEMDAALETLKRLSIGLLNRCRKKVFIGMSELDVRGYENRGLLVRIFQHILQSAYREAE